MRDIRRIAQARDAQDETQAQHKTSNEHGEDTPPPVTPPTPGHTFIFPFKALAHPGKTTLAEPASGTARVAATT